MTNEVVTKVEEMNWPDVIESAKDKFIEIKPHHMEFSAERAFAIQQLKGNDYLMKVATANKGSLQAAILNVAAIGLSLNPAKKQAYLVPRGGKVCLDASYMGLCDIATASGQIKWVQARIVRKSDKFIDNGPGEKPTHEYSPFATDEERGPFVGVYCVAKTADGDYLTGTMTASEVNDIKARSETGKKNTGPWVTDFFEQAKKTIVRRDYKMWPKTETMDRLALAIQLSNEAEGFQPILSAPRLGEYNEEQKIYFDSLITNSDSLGMYTFQCTSDESVFTNLYNSFEKGSITKYKKIVGDLTAKGASIMADCVTAIRDAIESGDDYAITETIEGMSSDTISVIRERLPANMVTKFDEVAKQQ